MTRSHVTTHVLDAATGRPVAGVAVVLLGPDGPIAEAATDGDGRVERLGPDLLPAGVYELRLETGAHYDALGVDHVHPRITLHVRIDGDPGQHWHLPVLLSPFAFTTYRGS
ncbi:MAG TPA: hydroxyisourate hydrolase [Micrococcales bacterium]|uniref:5-hydroxyisourate hydrolase n=1 Tax=Miniimonas arenae TaxID=676201 RepID=A0A5C5BCV6_9MICO|nr:hydroxyisourate hydrolase [Miniimonas arenae]TNU76191.1 hydroxyisourate hydrolase [Miniimonas arenae]HCX85261.1 hydroxyisourate hydrolase [Micrococcales bacterium]